MRFKLEVVQTRKSTDVAWFDFNNSTGWSEFNHVPRTDTITNPETQETSEIVVLSQKVFIPIETTVSEDELTQTRVFYSPTRNVLDELAAALQDDASVVSEEKHYNALYETEATYAVSELPGDWTEPSEEITDADRERERLIKENLRAQGILVD